MVDKSRPPRGRTGEGGGSAGNIGEDRFPNDSTIRRDPRNGRMVWARVHYDRLAGQLRGLSDLAAVAYIHLWTHYLAKGGVVEDEPVSLARVCYRSTAKWKSARKELIGAGVISVTDGMVQMPFADEQIRHFRKRSETYRQNAASRWADTSLEDAV
jgi:hypothetical protein